ncbi:DUF3576 domain-containing protein [Alphaproteobacteria bacterium]|nr:DUF3576 domain-containing protein [Alphaproteobacteria bacterium]|tara:strand:+ start:1294 stop:1854 length:561 start_codon:yes stop_codon:yes gene_type:complete
MLKVLSILLSLAFFYSCTGTHEGNMAKLDEAYGCDNPQRVLSKSKYRACLAKQRAGGETMFDLADSFDGLLGKGEGNIIYQSSVNPYLWNASLEVTDKYPLKIADNQGGFIETDWIYERDNLNQRCLIKIHIKSRELITTGISSNFLCEKKNGDSWSVENYDYVEEEKQITLKILEIAGELADKSL